MPTEPHASLPTIIPMLCYEDGPRSLDWLAFACGFRERTRMVEETGRLTHAQMEIDGGGLIMLATPSADYESPKRHRAACQSMQRSYGVPWVIDGVLAYVGDIDAHFARAKAAGATILSEIEEGFPGRRYRAEDLEGHRWMFMQKKQ